MTIFILALQVMIGAIGVYYIRKLIDVIPPIVDISSKEHPYVAHLGVSEAKGEISLAIIFVGIQTNAIHALEEIHDYGMKSSNKKD